MRRESFDHLIVFGEAHFCNILEKLTRRTTTMSGPVSHWTKMLQIFG
jgi:hypothetical protein